MKIKYSKYWNILEYFVRKIELETKTNQISVTLSRWRWGHNQLVSVQRDHTDGEC